MSLEWRKKGRNMGRERSTLLYFFFSSNLKRQKEKLVRGRKGTFGE